MYQLYVVRALRIALNDFQVMLGRNLFPISVSQGWDSYNSRNTSEQAFFFFLNSQLKRIQKALLLIHKAKMKAEVLRLFSMPFCISRSYVEQIFHQSPKPPCVLRNRSFRKQFITLQTNIQDTGGTDFCTLLIQTKQYNVREYCPKNSLYILLRILFETAQCSWNLLQC